MSNSKAQVRYHVRRKEIETKLRNIQHMIEAHQMNAGDDLNWEHVGDLAVVSEQLDEVASFLGKYPTAAPCDAPAQEIAPAAGSQGRRQENGKGE